MTGPGPGVPRLPGRPARARREAGNPFDAAAGEHYDAVRPSYPAESVAWVLEGLGDGLDVVEPGAGTACSLGPSPPCRSSGCGP